MAARVIERRRVVAPPAVEPVNPLALPANPLAVARNPLALTVRNPLAVKADPLASAGGNPLLVKASNPLASKVWARRHRDTRHMKIILPPGPPRYGKFYLPTWCVDRLCGCGGGCSPSYWSVRDSLDFTEAAVDTAQNEGCDDYCEVDEQAPDGRHAHFLDAVRLGMGECAMGLFDVEQPNAEDDDLWRAIFGFFADARRRILRSPDVILDDPVIGEGICRMALSKAGVLDGGEIRRWIGDHLDRPDIAAAFADTAVSVAAERLGWFEDLQTTIADAEDAELVIFWPVDLQTFVIDPDLVPGADQAVRMQGWWRAVEVRYHSVFDLGTDPMRYPWAIGWREIALVPKA